MLLKTSYFKKEIWKQGFRSVGWVGIAYFIALFFILPINIIMEKTRQDAEAITYHESFVENLFYLGEFQIILFLIVPVLAAIFSLRYMQVKGSADFVHSLPMHRSQLFVHQFSIGYLMVLVPIVLVSLILFVMYGIMDVNQIYKQSDIWNWLVISLTVSTFIYSFTFLIGMLTGMSIVQGLLSYVFIFFPTGILMLITYNIEMLLFGFDSNYFWGAELTNVTPIVWLLDHVYQDMHLSNLQLLYYWCVSIGSGLLAFWLYKIRDVEIANQPLAFTILKPFFKFGVTFCFMLLGGAYFGSVQGHFISWLSFGYLCGALLGYVLAEMLIQKTWRIFHQWKGFTIYVGISLLLLLSVIYDFYGYETRVPDQVDVEEVFIGDGMMPRQVEEIEANVTDPQLIQQIVDLHQYIIDSESIRNHFRYVYGPTSTDITITYFLENGRKLHRNYYIPDKKDIESYLEPIVESESYKQSTVAWLYDETKQFESIEIHGMNGTKEIVKKETIAQVRETLKRDYLTVPYEEIQHKQHQMNIIEFKTNDNYYQIPILNGFKHTNQLLHDENLANLLEIIADNVQMVAITNSNEKTEIFPNLPFTEEEQSDKWLMIDESEKVEKILRAKEKKNTNGTWEVGLYGPEREMFLTSFRLREEDIPMFVKKYFE